MPNCQDKSTQIPVLSKSAQIMTSELCTNANSDDALFDKMRFEDLMQTVQEDVNEENFDHIKELIEGMIEHIMVDSDDEIF